MDVQVSPRALRDLKKIQPGDRRLVTTALQRLADPEPLGAAAKTLIGAHPYLRLRAGDWRIIYCPLSHVDPNPAGPGWYVARVVNRRDLDTTVRSL
jgi:mRNA-degrading endonuclease RelE of RelBE toxin-antitoxin system